MAVIDYTNPVNYKPCSKKVFDAYLCRPPVGTAIIPKAVAKQLGMSRLLVARSDILNTGRRSRWVYELRANRVPGVISTSEAVPYIICDPITHEFQAAPIQGIASVFSFDKGEMITSTSLQRRSTLYNMPWSIIQPLRNSLAMKYMACFIPNTQKFVLQTVAGNVMVNQPGVDHGKGDFIVCPMLPNRMPDFQHIDVVNGIQFKHTYSNQGWTGALSTTNQNIWNTNDLPDLGGEFESIVEFFLCHANVVVVGKNIGIYHIKGRDKRDCKIVFDRMNRLVQVSAQTATGQSYEGRTLQLDELFVYLAELDTFSENDGHIKNSAFYNASVSKLASRGRRIPLPKVDITM